MNMSLRNLRGGIPGGLGSVNIHAVTYVASQIKQLKSMYQCFSGNVTAGTLMTAVTILRQHCVTSGNAPEWHREHMAVRGQAGKPGDACDTCLFPHRTTDWSIVHTSTATRLPCPRQLRMKQMTVVLSRPCIIRFLQLPFESPQEDFLLRALKHRVTWYKHDSI